MVRRTDNRRCVRVSGRRVVVLSLTLDGAGKVKDVAVVVQSSGTAVTIRI